MNRRNFITDISILTAAMTLSSFKKFTDDLPKADKMPVLFVGHGSPMNAIEDNEFSRAWKTAASALPKPTAILCVSAHWQTKGTKVTMMAKPRTIHDFYGFPPALEQKEYPAPGSPEFAKLTRETIHHTTVEGDDAWGLDHGTWSVVAQMYPLADVPVFQLSLDYSQSPAWHYELGKELAALRRKGVLIIGSGNMVHNLGMIQWKDEGYDWAIEFDAKLKKLIEQNDHRAIINYQDLGPAAKLAIPTNEHYLPLLYSLALQEKDEALSFFAEKTLMGSISMRSLRIGN